MSGVSRSRAVVVAGGVLLAMGAWLLVQDYLLVDAWIGYESYLAAPHPGTTPCFCPQYLAHFPLAPSPFAAVLSYGVAAPIALLVAWWIRRRARTAAPAGSARRRLEIASLLLVAGMGSVLGYFGLGVVLDALGWSVPGLLGFPFLGFPFLGLLLVVPLVVLLAGIFGLLGSALSGPTVRSRAAHG